MEALPPTSRYRSQTHMVAKAMRSGGVTGAVADFLQAITNILQGKSNLQALASSADGGGALAIVPSSQPLKGSHPPVLMSPRLSSKEFARLSPMEKVGDWEEIGCELEGC